MEVAQATRSFNCSGAICQGEPGVPLGSVGASVAVAGFPGDTQGGPGESLSEIWNIGRQISRKRRSGCLWGRGHSAQGPPWAPEGSILAPPGISPGPRVRAWYLRDPSWHSLDPPGTPGPPPKQISRASSIASLRDVSLFASLSLPLPLRSRSLSCSWLSLQFEICIESNRI